MAIKVKQFRGLIYSNFDSESDFARYLKWDKQRINKISNGQKQPSLQEIDQMAKPLGVSPDYLMQIFLHYKSPNRQQKSSDSPQAS